uniref:Uncharacterized protein n=1 Tax=Ignavibacterium album TaxID=591197 RepID=A0A7V3E672_9BACT
MKRLIIIIAIIFTVTHCESNKQPECICTTEFRSITVTVVDSLNNPNDSLDVNIVDEFGRRISPLSRQLPYQSGLYVVIDDSYVDYLSTQPLLIYFTASDSVGRIANTFFLVNTDECKCHVQKISGPERIVLK